MTLAERTREAVRARPFLADALAAGVVNYSAAARTLDVEGDEESIATALRRYADEIEPPTNDAGRISVRMNRGVGIGDPEDDATLAVGGTALVDGGDLTAVQASGEVDATALERVLGRLRVEGIHVEVAGVAGDALVVAVGGRDGADALRLVEDALDSWSGW